VTFTPGWAASNCFPSWVKVPRSEAAANTVIDPDNDGEAELPVLDGVAGLPEVLLDPQPARAVAAIPTIPAAAKVTVMRRTVNS
jgi:hypothetical protein